VATPLLRFYPCVPGEEAGSPIPWQRQDRVESPPIPPFLKLPVRRTNFLVIRHGPTVKVAAKDADTVEVPRNYVVAGFINIRQPGFAPFRFFIAARNPPPPADPVCAGPVKLCFIRVWKTVHPRFAIRA